MPMTSRNQIQDGGPHGGMVARSKMATSDTLGYTSEGESTP